MNLPDDYEHIMTTTSLDKSKKSEEDFVEEDLFLNDLYVTEEEELEDLEEDYDINIPDTDFDDFDDMDDFDY